MLYLRRLCLLAVTPTPFGRLPSEVLEEFLSDQRAWTFADRPAADGFFTRAGRLKPQRHTP